MTAKARRQSLIRSLVPTTPIESQEQLQRLLEASGIRVTQGTLSRDLREIGVVKGSRGYMLPESNGGGAPAEPQGRLDRAVLRSFVISVEAAGSLVVAKTGPGRAQVVAVELDGAGLPGVVGTLAGDDTIFLATRSPRGAERLALQLRQIAGLA